MDPMDPSQGLEESPVPHPHLPPKEALPVKVAEVFETAGVAFHRLSELVLGLQHIDAAGENMRWTDEDVERMRGSIMRFANDLEMITESVQSRTIRQMKTDLKRKIAMGDVADIDVMSTASGASSAKKPNQMGVGPSGQRQPMQHVVRNTPQPQSRGQPIVYTTVNDSFAADIGPPSF